MQGACVLTRGPACNSYKAAEGGQRMSEEIVVRPAQSKSAAPASAPPAASEPQLDLRSPVVEPVPVEAPWWNSGPGRGALIVLVLFALAYALRETRELVLPIVVGLLMAIVLAPIAAALRKLRVPHALAAGMVVVCFASALAAAVYGLAEPTASWIENAPQTFRGLEK